MTVKIAKYLSALRRHPSASDPIIDRTVPGARYEIVQTRLVEAEFWHLLRRGTVTCGWVRKRAHGVETFREARGG